MIKLAGNSKTALLDPEEIVGGNAWLGCPPASLPPGLFRRDKAAH